MADTSSPGYSSSWLAPSVFRRICRLLLSWQPLWRAAWLVVAWITVILFLCSDQLYLEGWQTRDVNTLERAVQLFPFDRTIALGPSYLFVATRGFDPRVAVGYVKRGAQWDPWAADLAKAEMVYDFETSDRVGAVAAFERFCKLVPRDHTVCRPQTLEQLNGPPAR